MRSQPQLVTLFAFIATVAFSSCKSFDPALLDARGEKLNPKLETLKPVIENNLVAIVSSDGSSVMGSNPLDVKTYFENEVQTNLIDPFGIPKGIIKLKVENYEQKQRVTWSPFLLGIPSLFGVPGTRAVSKVGVTIEIIMPNGQVIGQYKGTGQAVEVTRLWSKGESFKERYIARVAYLKSVQNAVADAKIGLLSDVDRLNQLLK
jgi:hypothetical protein